MNQTNRLATLVAVASLATLAGCPGPTPAPTYRLSGVVSGLTGSGLVLQNNGGDSLPVTASSGHDVGFTFSARLPSGSGYAVTVLTQPGGPAQRCTVLRNGSGTFGAADVTGVAVDCRAPRFAYVANGGSGGSNSISMYRVDAATGRLAGLGGVSGGMFPAAMAMESSGSHLYALSSETGQIFQYEVSAGGLLSPMSPAAFSPGLQTAALAFHPSGPFAYLAGRSGSAGMVAQFTVNAGGVLTPMATPSVPASDSPTAIVVHPTGRFAYVVSKGAGLVVSTVSQYGIDASGALALLTPAAVPAGVWPRAIAIDPTGRFAYVTNLGDNRTPGTVSQYAIDGGGALAPLTPATVATGTSPQGVTVDPSGRFAYVANAVDGTVSQFRIGPGGALASLSPATVTTRASPQTVVVDPAGTHAWVTCGTDDVVAQFAIGADGTLTPGAPQTAPAGAGPGVMILSTGPSATAAVPGGGGVYVANQGPGTGGSPTLSEYTVDVGGALTPSGTVSPMARGAGGAAALATDPSGRSLYMATTAWISQYAIGAGGALSPMSTPNLLVCYICTSVAVHPSGGYAYVLDASYSGLNTTPTIPNYIYQFVVGGDGGLVPFSSPSNAFGISAGYPTSLAVDPSGAHAYVVQRVSDTGGELYGLIDRFGIGPFGALFDVPVAGATRTGRGPVAMAIDPSGRFNYVANTSSGDISAYSIDPVTGQLTSIDCGGGPGCHANPSGAADFAAGLFPIGLAIDPAGRFLYAVNRGDGVAPGSISQFAIGAGGALTALSPASVAAGVGARAIAVDPSGQFAWVTSEGDLTGPGTVTLYVVGPSGALTPSPGGPIATGVGPRAIVSAGVFR